MEARPGGNCTKAARATASAVSPEESDIVKIISSRCPVGSIGPPEETGLFSFFEVKGHPQDRRIAVFKAKVCHIEKNFVLRQRCLTSKDGGRRLRRLLSDLQIQRFDQAEAIELAGHQLDQISLGSARHADRRAVFEP